MFNSISSLEQQVRDITHEVNHTTVDSELIQRMLTRAQQDLVRMTTRKYSPNYMMETVLTSADFTQLDSGGVSRIADLPALSFGFAINDVSASNGVSWIAVKQRPFFSNIQLDYTDAASSIPNSYSTMGNKIYVYPSLSGGTRLKIRYQFRPLQFVSELGRIVDFNADDGYLELYELSPDLSTDVDSRDAFINVVDPLSGVLKATLQLVEVDVDTNRVYFKTASPDRETVFGLPVASELPEMLAVDDLICHASGTCVPYLAADLTNYLVELAGFMLKRSLGKIANEDYSERDRIIDDVSKLWSGRENTTQIRRHRAVNVFNPQWLFRGGV